MVKSSKKFFIILIVVFLFFTGCRRKSGSNVSGPGSNDTTELPPPSPGSKTADSTAVNSDTTSGGGAVQAGLKFVFTPENVNLDAGNIGMFYRESNGSSLILQVDIAGGNNVYGVTFDVDYDSNKIRIKDVTEGDFLKKDGQITTLLHLNQLVTITRSGQVSGVSGNGNICLIELEAITAFDKINIGFKNQNITNNNNVEIFTDDKWYGGCLRYN